ncbi:hypothetical protein DAETH_25930 [Deinococcus aetherius]|uniref:Uncharacterized protein n=1 Tax=Deinococcus aetherius TaxID=200252 RepID=A0ABN6RIX1_9DEIO|nr:hypothetical protein [Deinococcus aetherius]BDP42624.1 hypothetical protein DAETH_25930 [Deinococcus aetherius]
MGKPSERGRPPGPHVPRAGRGAVWRGLRRDRAALLGRDLLSRLICGARASLIVGVVANSVAVVIGVLWHGLVGKLVMRFTNVMVEERTRYGTANCR